MVCLEQCEHIKLRKQREHMRQKPISVQEKLYGDEHQLQATTNYFRSVQADIWEWKKKKKKMKEVEDDDDDNEDERRTKNKTRTSCC